ncbi:hypothetical protein [Clostridium sp. DL1XJH146]
MKYIKPMYFVFSAFIVQAVTLYLVYESVDSQNSSRLMAGNLASIILVIIAIVFSIIKLIYDKKKENENKISWNVIFWLLCIILIGILVSSYKFIELYPAI